MKAVRKAKASVTGSHVRVAAVAVTSRLLTVGAARLAALAPAYDTSAASFLAPWDGVHFAGIAQAGGYEGLAEAEHAFFPLWPLSVRAGAEAVAVVQQAAAAGFKEWNVPPFATGFLDGTHAARRGVGGA